jgi:hypothetical protein
VQARTSRLVASALNISCQQVDRDEVRLRRTVGLKKDEYTLDKKHVTWVAQSRG